MEDEKRSLIERLIHVAMRSVLKAAGGEYHAIMVIVNAKTGDVAAATSITEPYLALKVFNQGGKGFARLVALQAGAATPLESESGKAN